MIRKNFKVVSLVIVLCAGLNGDKVPSSISQASILHSSFLFFSARYFSFF